jgi:MYXO-CTERM domain-containing protein
VFYTIDPGAAPGTYHINLDPSGTLFVSGDTGEAIPVDISDPGTVVVTPEPGSLALLGVAGLLALRRRRSA